MTATPLVAAGETADEALTREDPNEMLRALAALPPWHPSRPTVREQAIEAWLPLAATLARRFTGRGEPVQDLVQTATIGLIKAIDRFDVGRGSDFVAFAVPTIVGEIRRYFRDQAWDLHVPRRLQELRLAIAESSARLAQQLGHSPSVAELAEDLRVSPDEIREGLQVASAYQATSLDAPAWENGGEPGPTVGDLLGVEDAGLLLAELRLTVAPAVAALPPRERHILHLRFFGNLTQDQIADRIGISQMHVSRLLARSLEALRAHLLGTAEAGGQRTAPAAG